MAPYIPFKACFWGTAFPHSLQRTSQKNCKTRPPGTCCGEGIGAHRVPTVPRLVGRRVASNTCRAAGRAKDAGFGV